MRTRLSCAAVRRQLGAHHDGELTVATQVAVEAHCSHCAACAERLEAFSTMQELLQRGGVTVDSSPEAEAGSAAAVAAMLSATLASVVHQAVREKREDWPERVGRMMLDAPRFWIPGGAMAVGVAGAAVLATILSLYTPMDSRSLAAVLDPGSNQNPVSVARGVTLPQVSLDAGLALFLNESLTLPTPNLALAALVTREGEVARFEVLSPRVSAEDLAGSLARLSTDIRFKPAEYDGSPVAVNVVWLFEQTTVRPLSPQPEEHQTAPPLIS